jgi:FHS family Na+ dependent glucose MFS transporter 1
MILLGMAIANLGPVLIALGKQTHTSRAQMGGIFTMRSVGYLVGSGSNAMRNIKNHFFLSLFFFFFGAHLFPSPFSFFWKAVGGPLFDKFHGHRLIGTTMALMATGTAIVQTKQNKNRISTAHSLIHSFSIALLKVPLLTNFWVLGVAVSFTGIAMGFMDTGGNVVLMWIHGKDVGPYMQVSPKLDTSLHPSFPPLLAANRFFFIDSSFFLGRWSVWLSVHSWLDNGRRSCSCVGLLGHLNCNCSSCDMAFHFSSSKSKQQQ